MGKTVKAVVVLDATTLVEAVAPEVVPETVVLIVSQDVALPVSVDVRPTALLAVKVHVQADAPIQTASVQSKQIKKNPILLVQDGTFAYIFKNKFSVFFCNSDFFSDFKSDLFKPDTFQKQ